jgi:hypothetical protein
MTRILGTDNHHHHPSPHHHHHHLSSSASRAHVYLFERRPESPFDSAYQVPPAELSALYGIAKCVAVQYDNAYDVLSWITKVIHE